ncbi:hypothetical protein ACFVVA_12925 [Kitasatospora sp. NPDC058048]|uniref:hypothetical protein n=1 Tax=Kitasatospora sp. NPDC058048 TaxID=3346313 RepID=UPI0036DF0829
MTKPKSPLHSGDSTLRRRLLIGLGVLLVAGLLAGLLARLAGGGHATRTDPQPSSPPRPSSWAGIPAGPRANTPPAETGAIVARPPHTSSPTEFAEAFAQALWTYDSRKVAQPDFVSGLRLWLTSEIQYADGDSAAGQVPDPVLWSRLRDNGQTSTAGQVSAHVPDTYTKAIQQNPAAFTQAYIYAVTVTAKVNVTWDGGGQGAEDRAITLAVQCRPGNDCALAAVAPTVYP